MADRHFESNEAQRQWQQFQDYQQHKSNKKKDGYGDVVVVVVA